jgi:hypothetical protein
MVILGLSEFVELPSLELEHPASASAAVRRTADNIPMLRRFIAIPFVVCLGIKRLLGANPIR